MEQKYRRLGIATVCDEDSKSRDLNQRNQIATRRRKGFDLLLNYGFNLNRRGLPQVRPLPTTRRSKLFAEVGRRHDRSAPLVLNSASCRAGSLGSAHGDINPSACPISALAVIALARSSDEILDGISEIRVWESVLEWTIEPGRSYAARPTNGRSELVLPKAPLRFDIRVNVARALGSAP
ncbi:hypothetical protein NL676_033953 [Syzygium grande]|nr:hypothetical protein NL676_033953 [Syzygium grande]